MTTPVPGDTPAAAASIAAQIARLPELSMEDLWALWDECFDRRPNHHQRTYLAPAATQKRPVVAPSKAATRGGPDGGPELRVF